MADIRRTWPSGDFDAIAIVAVDGEFEVEGTDGQEVVLEGEVDSDFPRGSTIHSGSTFDVQQTGRWLRIQMLGRPGETELRLRLPRQKAWVFEIGVARGDVEIRDVQARLHVNLGQGDVEIRDSRGVFAVHTGKGDVKLGRCAETNVPERPAMPQPEIATGAMAGTASAFAWSWGPGFGWPGHGPGEPWRCGEWLRDWMGSIPWQEWFGAAWEKWGQFLGTSGQGLNVGVARGDVSLSQVDTSSARIRIGSGDFRLQGGQIDRLQVRLGRGDVECDAIPAAQSTWSIDIRHGDIKLGLPADAAARLDVATRHGEIRSDFPLVRASRPGPEARHGSRMVGAIGRGENPAQISLTTLRGDISIRRIEATRAEPQEDRIAADQQKWTPTGETRPASPEHTPPATTPEPAPASPGNGTPPAPDPRLAILESLSRGEITVEEAAVLLEQLN